MKKILLLVVGLTAARAAAAEPSLEFRVAGASVAVVSLSSLEKAVPARDVTLSNAEFWTGRDKRYRAFALRDVLDFAFGKKWLADDYSDISFVALDGYAAVGPLAKAGEDGGYLAFKDLDVPSGWEPVGGHKADPGPFFVVWTGAAQTTENRYPWPWQVAALNLVRFEDQYPKALPHGAAAGSPERRGYALFKGRCFRCHSVNGEGGKIGPDLNEPMSVTAYRPKRMVKEFIRNPSKYRHTYMPDHRDLSAQDLEDLWRYFHWLDGHRPKGDGW
jgi:mono/diheme cytochrome c family protein